MQQLQRYVRYARTIRPKLTPDAQREVVEAYVKLARGLAADRRRRTGSGSSALVRLSERSRGCTVGTSSRRTSAGAEALIESSSLSTRGISRSSRTTARTTTWRISGRSFPTDGSRRTGIRRWSRTRTPAAEVGEEGEATRTNPGSGISGRRAPRGGRRRQRGGVRARLVARRDRALWFSKCETCSWGTSDGRSWRTRRSWGAGISRRTHGVVHQGGGGHAGDRGCGTSSRSSSSL